MTIVLRVIAGIVVWLALEAIMLILLQAFGYGKNKL